MRMGEKGSVPFVWEPYGAHLWALLCACALVPYPMITQKKRDSVSTVFAIALHEKSA